MNGVLEYAERYVAAGLSVAPVRRDGSKAPAGEWKAFQSARAGLDVLSQWFSRGEYGVAIIAGAVSGNLEVLDVDTPDLLDSIWRRLRDTVPKLKGAVRVHTPKGGGHVVYRCESKPPGNQKLAARLVADPSAKTGSRKQTLIETRGEGGYIIAPGSPPDCHPTKKPYVLSAGTFEALPVLTDAEREKVYEVARSFDQLPKADPAPKQGKPTGENAGSRPGDEFAARTSWAEILEPHAWALAYLDSKGVSHWRRPGKTDEGTSATTNYGGSDLLYVFSSNADPFEDGASYSKFGAYAMLEHDGDFAATAKALAPKGYGKPRESRARPSSGNGAGLHGVGDVVVGGAGDVHGDDDVGVGAEFAHLTDLGNAERLLKRHGENIRWCEPWRSFNVWNGQVWLQDMMRMPHRLAALTVRSIYAEAAARESKEEREAVANHAKRSESERSIHAMLELVKSMPSIAVLPDDLDRDPWLLNVLNGTIDLRTGELRKHQREDLITKLAAVAYDPAAEAPVFQWFLRSITRESEDLIDFLQRSFGYCATGDTRERVLFIAWGGGRNGKSTLLGAVQHVLGDYAVTAPTRTFMAKRGDDVPNDLAALKGSRFVLASETSSGRALDMALVKQVTGNDRISARFMRAEWFDYLPSFKLWLATNHKPVIRDQSAGAWDRLRLVPFAERFVPKEEADAATPSDRIVDPEMGARLKAESAGILAWIVQGCLKWQRDGLGVPEEVRAATNKYRTEMDVLADFVEERCVRGERFWVRSDELYKDYATWAKDRGEKEPMSHQTLGNLLAERGYARDRRLVDGAKRTRWLGISIGHNPREESAEETLPF